MVIINRICPHFKRNLGDGWSLLTSGRCAEIEQEIKVRLGGIWSSYYLDVVVATIFYVEKIPTMAMAFLEIPSFLKPLLYSFHKNTY